MLPDDLKTDEVDAPTVPKGDLSEPAKAAREEDANAEAGAAESVVEGLSDDLGAARDANGEVAAVLANALAAKP